MKVIVGTFAVVLLVLSLEAVLNFPGAEAQGARIDPSNFSAFSDIPMSRQQPSMAGRAGVAAATVGIAVLSCSFVFLLGMYEELCHRHTYTNTKQSKMRRSATVGSRYGGSRYRPPNTRVVQSSA